MMLRSERLSDLPGLRHAFFTREGGVSEGAWASLNMGLRGGDDLTRVAENRSRAAAALGVPAGRLVTARQVHGKVALVVREPWDNLAAPEADALVTDEKGLLLGVLTADCGPLLLADREAGVIGAAHAGWKGALDGIVEATVAAMAGLGAEPARIVAALGPCIARDSYEVGPEFVARFAETDGASASFFRPAPGHVKALFDLKGYVAARLRRAGVERIEVLAYDTCARDDLFFSFRRTTRRGEDRFGLQLSAIVLEG
jgi:YfiH family protein